MYIPIPVSKSVDEFVRTVVREAIDPRLSDIHSMLRLPIPSDEGLSAGCNFSIADVLFGVIEGVSAVLWPRDGEPSSIFKQCVTKHYHSSAERTSGGLPDDQVAYVLWERFRNAMQHTLGIALDRPDKQGMRALIKNAEPLIVFRERESGSEKQLEEMERDWPNFLHRPTLARHPDGLYLSVEAFYVGTRRLIGSVLADVEQMRYASDKLRPAPFVATQSSANGAVCITEYKAAILPTSSSCSDL